MRILAGLCLVAAVLLCPCALAQEPEPPPTKGTFDEKGGTGRMTLPTKRIYGERFHRNIKIPGPRPIRPHRMLAPPENSRHGPMRTPDYRIAPHRSFESARADVDLIHGNTWEKVTPIPPPDRAPLSILENPRPYEPRRIDSCAPRCNPDRPARRRGIDRTVAIRGSDQHHTNDDRIVRTTARNPAAGGLAPRPTAPTPTSLGLGEGPTLDLSLVGRDPEGAVAQLRAYLAAYPDDFHAVRGYALALLARKDAVGAAPVMASAYSADPLLVREPIDPVALGLGERQITAMVTAAQSTASRTGGNAWLLVVVLHQGQGDLAKAGAALGRAKGAGLPPDLVGAFEGEFAPRAGGNR